MHSQIILKKYAINVKKKIIQAKINRQYFTKPFKHLIINNVLEYNFAKKCMNNFPNLKNKIWEKSNLDGIEIKFRSTWKSEFDIPPYLISLVRILNSSIILEALSIKFKIPKLISDSYFSGGGLNVTEKGGLLDVHVDGNYHDATGLNRRINVLIYFNQGWKKNWVENSVYIAEMEKNV